MTKRHVIETELKHAGVRHAQAEQVAFAAARWIKGGAAPEQALLAALYVWGPSNRKRCRALALEARKYLPEVPTGGDDAQVAAILFAHSMLVELRVKEPQDALLRLVRHRAHTDKRIQNAIDSVSPDRWFTTPGTVAA